MLASSPRYMKSYKIAEKAGIGPTYDIVEGHPTLTCNSTENNLLEQLEKGAIIGKRGIKNFVNSNTIVFTDGEEAEVDAVVFCTGYKIGYPWLDKRVLEVGEDNTVSLYHYMFPTNGYNNIAWIALCQPVGSMVMICEMQNRYALAVFKRQISLPPLKVMIEEAKKRQERIGNWYYPSPRHTIQCHVRKYLDDIGEELGVTPTLWRLLFQAPMFLYLAYTRPTMGAHYRILGPGACKKIARQILIQEYNLLYKDAPCFKGLEIFKTWAKNMILLLLAIYYQLKSLFTTGKFYFEPWI